MYTNNLYSDYLYYISSSISSKDTNQTYLSSSLQKCWFVVWWETKKSTKGSVKRGVPSENSAVVVGRGDAKLVLQEEERRPQSEMPGFEDYRTVYH